MRVYRKINRNDESKSLLTKSYPENVVWSEDGSQICFRDLEFIIN
jgi:hypothetical protein